MIKVISFDMDGTLLDGVIDDYFWFEEIPKLYSERHKVSILKAKQITRKAYDDLGQDDLRWYDPQYWFDVFDIKAKPVEILKDLKGHIFVYPEVITVLKELKKDYKLVILTRSTKDFVEIKTEVDGLKNYFDHIFSAISDFREVNKHHGIYKMMLDVLNVKPDEIIHIGNELKNDYETPNSLGIKSFIVSRNGKIRGQFAVKNFNEFLERVKLL